VDILQKMFDDLFNEEFSFPAMASRLAEKKLKEHGKTLNARQRARLKRAFAEAEAEAETPSDKEAATITITIPDSSILNRLAFFRRKPVEHIILNLAELDLDDVLNRLVDSIPSIIEQAGTATAELILEELIRVSPKMLAQHHKELQQFHRVVRNSWARPLDLLETMIVLALEAGDDFNSEFRESAASTNDTVFEALTRLHARACQVAGEVHALLSAGYADGAHARWRSLHEINVVALFVASRGNELAERYLLHVGVESHKAAKPYQTYADRLGYEPLDEEELKAISEVSAQLIARFGPDYANDYGWASDALANPRPTFADIERAVDLQHLRPHYRMASHNVHANPRGALFRLGLYPGSEDILLAGPSTAGFADPGQGAAISLGGITIALLTLRPNLDRVVMAQVFLRIVDMIGSEFLAAQEANEKLPPA